MRTKFVRNIFVIFLWLITIGVNTGCGPVTPIPTSTPTPTLTHTPPPTVTKMPTKTPTETVTPTTVQGLGKYKSTTLIDIIQRFSDEVSGLDAGVTLYFSESYKVRVIYTGKFRPIRQCAISLWNIYRGVQGLKGFDGVYKNEALFVENEVEYWMPVQEQVIPYFKDEVEENQEVNLYIAWLGMYHQDSCHMDWIFFDVDFDTR